jgi:hypothetical protein
MKISKKECNLQEIIRLMKSNYNSHLNKPRNVNLDNLTDYFDEQSHNRMEYY